MPIKWSSKPPIVSHSVVVLTIFITWAGVDFTVCRQLLQPNFCRTRNFLCQQALRSWKIRSYLTNVHDNLMLRWVNSEVTLVCQTSQYSFEALVMIVEATFLSIVRVHLEIFYDGVDCSTETPSPAGLSENPCESIDSAL